MSLKVQVDVNTTFTALLDVTDFSWIDFEHYDVINYVGLDGVIHYCPAIRNDFINNSDYNKIVYQGMRYTYDPNLPTVKFYSHATYILPNKKAKIAYDIPAGTYIPTAFEYLIKQFISLGRSRKISLACNVMVNGQQLSVSANTSIYYVNVGASPWNERFVCFGVSGPGRFAANISFTNYKSYCVGGHKSTTTGWGFQFASWAKYPITVFDGIKFV